MGFNPNTDLPKLWRKVIDRNGFLASAAAQATYLLGFDAAAGEAATGGASTGLCAFWFDPADWQVAARTTQIRVRGELVTNAVAPGASTVFTFGCYPVATWGGASNALPTVATFGTVSVACPAISNPAANTATHVEATPVNAPAAGWYVLACVLSGAAAASGAVETMVAELQVTYL